MPNTSHLLINTELAEKFSNRLKSAAKNLIGILDSGSHCVWPERRNGRVFLHADSQ